MKKSSGVGILLGSAALAGAMLLLAAVFAQAMLSLPSAAVPVPTPTATPPAPEADPVRPVGEMPAEAGNPSDEALPVEALRLAVDRAPFAPDRQAPSDRYRMPGERVVVAEAPSAPPELPPAPDFRLLGTVTGAEGGIAVVQIDGERPHVMSMGEELSGYRVASIGSGNVTMQGQWHSVNLTVAGPMPTGPAGPDEGDRHGRGADDEQARILESVLERALRIAQDLEERGAGEVSTRLPGGLQLTSTGASGDSTPCGWPWPCFRSRTVKRSPSCSIPRSGRANGSYPSGR
jgi:hypothetical protein